MQFVTNFKTWYSFPNMTLEHPEQGVASLLEIIHDQVEYQRYLDSYGHGHSLRNSEVPAMSFEGWRNFQKIVIIYLIDLGVLTKKP